MKNRWFEVDKDGLRKLIERQGMGRLNAKLVQDTLNEEMTSVIIQLSLMLGLR